MRRVAGILSILGLICAAALPALADTTITIFGQKYNVVKQSRAQTYKNGVQIHLDNGVDGVNNFAGVYFAPGTDITNDRLYFAARIEKSASSLGDQLYYLQTSDANGQFTPAVSIAKSFFGGNVDREHGGRPANVIELNRDNEGDGQKKDRNILALTYFDDDSFRMYDLDAMTKVRVTDALFQRVDAANGVDVGDAGTRDADPNLPRGEYPCPAHLPKADGHTVLMAGGPGNNGETAIGIWDTRQDDAYDALTDITEQTRSAAKPFPQDDGQGNNLACMVIARYDDQGEYWFLLDSPVPNNSSDTARVAIVLVRAHLDVPADPSTAKSGDLKMTVLDKQDMLAAADILFPKGTAGLTGITVGRPVGNSNLRMLYTTDYDGNFYTLTPAQ